MFLFTPLSSTVSFLSRRAKNEYKKLILVSNRISRIQPGFLVFKPVSTSYFFEFVVWTSSTVTSSLPQWHAALRGWLAFLATRMVHDSISELKHEWVSPTTLRKQARGNSLVWLPVAVLYIDATAPRQKKEITPLQAVVMLSSILQQECFTNLILISMNSIVLLYLTPSPVFFLLLAASWRNSFTSYVVRWW